MKQTSSASNIINMGMSEKKLTAAGERNLESHKVTSTEKANS